METIKAIVETVDDNRFITIDARGHKVSIPLSEDKPNEVKSVFNKLIALLKDGLFCIELEEIEEDLFSQVSLEYIAQLNREIQEIFGEMQEYGLAQDLPEK